MIYASESRAEGALAKKLNNLVSVADMVAHDDLIVTLIVIISVVVNKFRIAIVSLAAAALVLSARLIL